jgi:hypothetical protein
MKGFVPLEVKTFQISTSIFCVNLFAITIAYSILIAPPRGGYLSARIIGNILGFSCLINELFSAYTRYRGDWIKRET